MPDADETAATPDPTAPSAAPAPSARRATRLPPAVQTALARALDLLQRLRAQLRRAPAIAVVIVLVVLVYEWRYLTFKGWRVGGDGFYSWIFARSLAFDGDLHLRNDYALCGDPWAMGVDEGGHRPANPFYLGPALLWAPILRLLRAIVPLGAHPSPAWRNGCEGPLPTATLAFAPVFVGLTLYLGYRVARRFCSERAAIAAVLVVAFCSPLLHYGSLIVSYSHVWAAFGAAVALLTWVRATEKPASLLRWFVAGLGVGVAALMRSQAAVLILTPAITLLLQLVGELRARRLPLRTIASGAATVAGFLALFWIQLYSYKLLYGHWWVVPQGRAYLQLAHGHPFLTLFAPRGGFLYWHPLMWLGTLGLLMLALRRRTAALGVALFIPLAIDVYVSSSVLDWHGGASYGARRLCTLAAPWVATTGLFLAWLWAWLSRSRGRVIAFAATGWLLPWVIINFGGSTANVDDRIGYSRAVPMPELYGMSLRYGLDGVYEAVGNPFVLPASSLFALRYGVHVRRFDAMAGGGLFEHAYRPVRRFGADTIPFANPAIDGMLLSGIARNGEGGLIRAGTQGRMLTELGWPYVSAVELGARPVQPRPAQIALTSARFFGRHHLGTVTVPAGGGTVQLRVAPEAFSSGQNEIIFEPNADVVVSFWRWIDTARHDSSIR